MKLSEIIDHLCKRGYAARKRWNGQSTVFWGMDNLAWTTQRIGGKTVKRLYVPSLADIKADDWETLDFFWNGSSGEEKQFIAVHGNEK